MAVKSHFAYLLPLPCLSLMAESLFYVDITICYHEYSILLFQKQAFSAGFSVIWLTLS